MRSAGRARLVTMKPTRGQSSPGCHSTLATTRRVPALRLISEAGVIPAHLKRRSTDGTREHVADLALQNVVGRQPYRIAIALGFEELIDLRIGEGRVAAEIAPLHRASVTGDHRLQNVPPAGGAVDVSRTQRAPLQIAELVEHEQRVIARTAEVPIVGTA